ncbi:hypothetical protein VNO77_42995 [Canavalia gladiata]|uniref:NB-ARC domain-containing protein n=1 Tax=Canavalia gladiata TaxID=3824 RepID=A0AAN9JTE7_CANGL
MIFKKNGEVLRIMEVRTKFDKGKGRLIYNCSNMKVAVAARQLVNLTSYKRILEKLTNEVNNLQGRRQRVQENLTWDSEEFETQIDWLKRVDEIIGKINALLIYYEGKGTCTRFLRWYKVGEPARKMLINISQLYEEGKFYQTAKPAEGYKGPKSRIDTVNDIMVALNDTAIQIVGVWGLGGGGTTSLAKQVQQQAEEEGLFNILIIITITRKPTVEEVQEEIAVVLGLQFHGEKPQVRRNRLRQRIKKEKNILLIVNDIWGKLNPQEFDLEEVGVPLSDANKVCKLLVTSGNLDFLQNMKGSSKVFQIEMLLENEAFSLFEEIVGESVPQDWYASSMVGEIVKSCAGSPPLIFAIAMTLRNKDLDAWQDALVQLKENVSPIKLCFNSLEDEELKYLFLLLTIRGRSTINKNNIYTDMWSGLFKNLDTLESTRNRCDSLISDLIACGLLVEDKKEWVKIDDLIWQSAYSIAQSSLKASIIFEGWPPEDWLRSLRFCNMTIMSGLQVPERLQCPELQEIILNANTSSMQIPDSFFEESQLLKVLVLNKFDCSKLPSSLSLLNHLEALSMYNCKLEDLTMIGDLANLRMLVFLGSTIQRLPKQIGKLQKLLLLDLTDTYLQVIPPNVLSNLTSLEEIYLRNSFCNWKVERSNNENNNASLKELTNLHHLVCVKELCVPDPQAWPMDLFFEKLKSYTILIGDRWGQTHDVKLDKRFHLEDGIKQMMKNVDVLYLDELNGVQNVSDLDSNGFPHLRSLVVKYNAEVKCVAKMSGHVLDTFPNLDSMSLYNLTNFEYICHGPLIGKSFFNVRVIKIQECNGMKYLFSTSMFKGLPHLADMEVSECKLLEAIVLVEGGENPHMEFPELTSLTLRGLPALISFCIIKETSYIDTSTLFQNQVSCPKLENMVISHAKKLMMIWNESYDAPNSFWKLKNVSITGCEKLTTIFPVNLSRNLYNLKMLEVINCSSLTSIFTVMRQDNKQLQLRMSFQLISINLVQLPKLEYVCVGFGLEALKEKLEEERKKEALEKILEEERKKEALRKKLEEKRMVDALKEKLEEERKKEALKEKLEEERKKEALKEILEEDRKIEALLKKLKGNIMVDELDILEDERNKRRERLKAIEQEKRVDDADKFPEYSQRLRQKIQPKAEGSSSGDEGSNIKDEDPFSDYIQRAKKKIRPQAEGSNIKDADQFSEYIQRAKKKLLGFDKGRERWWNKR